MKRALISVYDKRGLLPLAQCLQEHDYQIISTGGTKQFLLDNGISLYDVETVTDSPEMMGGRVKTLHPRIHGGILMRPGIDDHEALENNIQRINIVIVNLYPFEKVITDDKHTFQDAIENIDIGGPAMIRAAAKNYQYVTVVTEPEDYKEVISEIETHGEVRGSIRFGYAQQAFEITSRYDATISDYLWNLQ